MAKELSFKVVIIGAGLSGLTLALFLKKYNISTAIYESKPKDFAAGGNIALSPNALRVLSHVGVYETIRTAGFAFDTVTFLNGRGGELAKVLNGSCKIYNFPALRIKRATLRSILLDECAAAGVPVYYDRKCVGIISEDEDSATVGFEGGSEVTAEYVVGSDGIHSRIRGFVRPDAREVFQNLAGISGTFKLSDLADVDTKSLPLPCMLFGGNGSFAVMPATADGDNVSYFATFEVQERPREEWAALDGDKEEMSRWLKGRFPENSTWPELVRALCNRAPPSSLSLWPFYLVPPGETWSSPHKRVILIGDAAHAMPPTGGQGGASSFEDAETLAHTFAHLYAPDFNSGYRAVVVRAWEDHRIPRVKKVMDFTSFNGDLRKTSANAVHQFMKETLIWLVLKFRGQKMGCEWIYEYNAEDVRACLGNIGRPESK